CMDDDIRIDYSKSLLSLSLKQNGLLMPLAFGESNTKARVKNVLRYVKKSRFISILAMLLISIAFITLLTSTTKETTTRKLSPDEQLLLESIKKDDLCKELLKNRTPYIGDNSKVLALVYTLSVPDGLKYKSIELQTKTEPYELHVYYEYDSKHKVDNIDNTMEFQNAALLFATIENMGKYTIHRLYEGGESTLTYNREELEEEFVENFYSYSEEWRLLRNLMYRAQSYLNTPVKYHDVEKYTGEALTIGIIGETPTIREKQVKFVSLEFSDLEDGTVDTKYDAIFITRDNLSQAAEDKYAPIYKNSKVPLFFINSKKSYVPFTDENYSYEDGLIFGEYIYLDGILYNTEREGYQFWGFGLYNDIESQENIIAVYSNVFRTISELKNKDNNFNDNDLKEINKGE
ncbi:MAG: hypothetical protein K0S41_1385, partial [Anaerocolumna sp.]|nr:hypothetical protein [Anaerocolumna sp.]